MSVNLAVLTRLSRIADEPASDVARAAAARALVDAYTHSLYGRLGIVATRRPSRRAKQDAKNAFDALRLTVFRAELAAEAGAARVFATARQRIEMARRALDLRLVEDEGPEGAKVHQPAGSCDAPRDDRRVINDLRHSLRDRRAIVTSWEAIRQSRDLLARFAAPLVH